MSNVWVIFKRELAGYFYTPIAYVFLAIFVFVSGIFTFYLGSFLDRQQADLTACQDRVHSYELTGLCTGYPGP